jgi:hypothetical protein
VARDDPEGEVQLAPEVVRGHGQKPGTNLIKLNFIVTCSMLANNDFEILKHRHYLPKRQKCHVDMNHIQGGTQTNEPLSTTILQILQIVRAKSSSTFLVLEPNMPKPFRLGSNKAFLP